MYLKVSAATAASLYRGGLSLHEATKAGIAATACSTLLLTIILLAMLLLPVGIG